VEFPRSPDSEVCFITGVATGRPLLLTDFQCPRKTGSDESKIAMWERLPGDRLVSAIELPAGCAIDVLRDWTT